MCVFERIFVWIMCCLVVVFVTIIGVSEEWLYNPPARVFDRTFYYNTDGSYFYDLSDKETESPKVIADGDCVDESNAILQILKRYYKDYSKVRVAVSRDHAQVVIQEIDGSLEYLELDGITVVVGDFRSYKDLAVIVKPEDFISATSIYKPEISLAELKSFLNEKYATK